MSNDSIWFTMDKDFTECWWSRKPYRYEDCWIPHEDEPDGILFPGAIKAITGRTLTWQDEPIEWKPVEKILNVPNWDEMTSEAESYINENTTDLMRPAMFREGALWAIEQIKKLNQ